MSEEKTQRVMFSFPPEAVDNPTITTLVRKYDLCVNVFRARMTPEESGFLLMDITGSQRNIDNGLEYVRSLGIEVHYGEKGLMWDSDICTGCGNCLTHCPTHALHIDDRQSMKVVFDEAKCIECLACTKACPFGACRSVF